MSSAKRLVVGDPQTGPQGEWVLPPGPDGDKWAPILFVGDPLDESTDTRGVATALAELGWRVLWVDVDSLACQGDPVAAVAGDADPIWGLEEAYSDRIAVRELGRLAQALAPACPCVVGEGMGATWALLMGCQSRAVSAAACINGRMVYPRLGPTKPVQPLEMILNLDVPVLLVEEGETVDGSLELAQERFGAFGIPVAVERIQGPPERDEDSPIRVAARVHLFLSSTPTEAS